MRVFLAVGMGMLSVLALAQEPSPHGDPYQNEWRRSKQNSIQILSKIKAMYLLKTAPLEVITWLSQVDEKGESTFKKMAKELSDSEVIFAGIEESNPEGTCGHTGLTPGSPIKISRKDCGTVTERQRWETLIGDTAHHFGHGNEFSAWVGMAIADGFELQRELNPFAELEPRYRGEVDGKIVVVNLSEDRKKILSLSGPVSLDFKRFPAMKRKGTALQTEGVTGSFGCETWGLGRTPGTGAIGYGALEGGDYRKNLSAEVSLMPHGSIGHYRISVSYEVAPRKGDDCRGVKEWLSSVLVPYPPTPKELAVIAAAQVAAKEANRRESNWKACLEAIKNKDNATVFELITSGIPAQRFEELLQLALSHQNLPLTERLLNDSPNLGDVTYALIDSKDASFVVAALQSPLIRSHLNFKTLRNHYSPIGYIVNRDKLGRRFEKREDWENYASEILPALFAAGADPLAVISDFSNRASHALIGALYTPFPSPQIIEVLAKAVGNADLPNRDERKALDYLTFHWLLFKNHCKAPTENTVEGKASYQRQMARYQAIFDLLKKNGSNGLRTNQGFLYYDNVSCSYSKERGYQFFISTSYSPKPSNTGSTGG